MGLTTANPAWDEPRTNWRSLNRHLISTMKLPRRKFLQLGVAGAALPALWRVASAQTYPSRPVRMIVPFAPGGQVDAIGRLLAQKLSGHFDKQFYVENISGA